MSTNPFRRENSRPSAPTSFRSDPLNIAKDVVPNASSDLSVNTKLPPGSIDRHVSFASPPVDSTIPAAEYPSSPESTRFSPVFQFASPATPAPTDYSIAIHADPFGGELRDEKDGVIGEALQNAQNNAVLTEAVNSKPHEDAVKTTLSRFATTPRKSTAPVSKANDKGDDHGLSRQTMDVESFKRLLLTGDSGQSTPKDSGGSSNNPGSTNGNDNGSSADTSSLSQHSTFEPTTAAEETPRSSHEFEAADVDFRSYHARGTAAEVKKKAEPPPTPTPRRTKSVKNSQPEIKSEPSHPDTSAGEQAPMKSDSKRTEQSAIPKRPPTPPLARKQSYKAGAGRSDKPQALSGTEQDVESISPVSGTRAPPPPPSRRRGSGSGWASMDLAPTAEESESLPESVSSSRKPAGVRPPPPPARNSSSVKRASLGMMSPPPLPPPRRGRGSSRSSIDSHRPSLSAIVGDADSARNSGEFVRLGDDGRRVSASSNASNILADLATLQRELEEARQKNR